MRDGALRELEGTSSHRNACGGRGKKMPVRECQRSATKLSEMKSSKVFLGATSCGEENLCAD